MNSVKVTASLTGNMGFKMTLDDHHEIITDAAESIGGNDLGPRPKQLLLTALIGCTGIDTMSILKKMRVELDDVIIEAETKQTEDHPKVYENIHLTYTFVGGDDVDVEKLKKAVKLSQEKYCGVTAMLEKATPVTYEVVFKNK